MKQSKLKLIPLAFMMTLSGQAQAEQSDYDWMAGMEAEMKAATEDAIFDGTDEMSIMIKAKLKAEREAAEAVAKVAAKAAAKAAAEAARRFQLAIPVLEAKGMVAGVEWVTDEATFDYVLPCDTEAPYAAILAHGANRMDLLQENDNGELVHDRDMSIGAERMADFCVAIGAPKSGLSTTYNEDDESQEWRTWWMTEGVEDENGVPVRDEAEEIQATIDLIKLAKEALNSPVYIVIGNDLGKFATKVISKLGADGDFDYIDGFISVDRETGEFTIHGKNGALWNSADHTPSD
jgi:hypothetical protein